MSARRIVIASASLAAAVAVGTALGTIGGRLITAALLAVGIGASAHACERVDIHVEEFDPVELRLPMWDLEDMVGSPVAGLVVAKAQASYDEASCTLRVGWIDAKVVVAKELKGCAAEHVRAHEMEHVAIYRAAADHAKGWLQTLIGAGMHPLAAAERMFSVVRDQQDELDAEDNGNDSACNGAVTAAYRRT